MNVEIAQGEDIAAIGQIVARFADRDQGRWEGFWPCGFVLILGTIEGDYRAGVCEP